MVEALGLTTAFKLLLPFTQEPVIVVGTTSEPLPHQVDDLVERYLVPLLAAVNRPAERPLEAGAAAGGRKLRRRRAGGPRGCLVRGTGCAHPAEKEMMSWKE